jgi:hypothetical protein
VWSAFFLYTQIFRQPSVSDIGWQYHTRTSYLAEAQVNSLIFMDIITYIRKDYAPLKHNLECHIGSMWLKTESIRIIWSWNYQDQQQKIQELRANNSRIKIYSYVWKINALYETCSREQVVAQVHYQISWDYVNEVHNMNWDTRITD